ncbi:tRNA pseudouridine(38-40) synthase TruA [Anaerocolumna chitinilytica]|uniref:tRNA pseudouridine synthase A n=1 Tax=Anaerocolumna chitinilytica TaxID=1727145 RepID=A0A7M3SAR0_9FIRM|nr:tRNA pseudouridine(38-40) synthase TruA [Anaerocolumna chitinilytica]BCK01678.1 tRNA pseudouridine synthase A [Anaerocolumna chitinilytica]
MRLRNIKLILAYDGNRYAGWQRLKGEKGKRSVQSVLEESLSLVLQEDIRITGSGRTDKGVHAMGQAANFKCHTELATPQLQALTNKVLPEDIRILDAKEVPMAFHSRKSAITKTYEYHVEIGKIPSVFHRGYVYAIEKELDMKAMKEAAGLLLGTHDFRAFSSEKREDYNTIRRIDSILVEPFILSEYICSKQVRISVTGNGFLYNMVRIIVGTLLEIGLQERKAEDIIHIFESGKRENAGVTLPPEGLYLKEVTFPVEINFKIK